MAQFASDTFTGTEGTELSAYAAAWTRHTSYTINSEIAANRARQSASLGGSAYWHSGTPASADYSVSADLFFKETNGGTSGAGPIGRVDTAANTFYHARYIGSTADAWQLYKFVAGATTLLGSSAQAITDETSHNCKLRMVGTTIEVYVDGGATALISVTDSAIAAAGKAGLRFFDNTTTPSDTVGIHIDNFSAVDISGDQTLTPSLFTNSNTFYAPTVSGTYTLSPGLYTDSDTFYSPTVSTSYSISPGLYTDPDTFYSPAVSATYTLTPGLYDGGDTFYTHVVSLGGSQTLVPGLYVDSDTFYSPTVSSTYTLTPALYADPDTFYSATISSTYVIAPTLYVDPDTFYAATVGSFGGPQTLLPSLYVDPDTFYVHTITGGLGSGVGQRTRYITVEFYDGGDVWRTNIARDILEYSTQPSKIAFSYVSPQDSISYASGTDKIHYTRGQRIQRRSAFKKVFVAPPPPPTDPYFSNVVTLLHMDGADGSTVFTDVKGHAFTAVGNAQIDTAQSKFGGASGLFDGSGDYLTTPDSADWDFGTGDFTVEFFIRFNALPSSNAHTFVGNYVSGTSGWYVQFRNDSPGARLTFGSSGDTPQNDFTWSPSTATWYHVAVARASGTVRAFVDGNQIGSGITNTEDISGSTGVLMVGGLNLGPIQYINAYLDELRITKGVARYTANFTPPTEPFLDQ